VSITDTNNATSLPFVKDTRPPVIRLWSNPPRLWLSEASTVTVRVNGSLRRLQLPGPGVLSLDGIKRVRTLIAVARDTAGTTAILRRP